MRAEIRHIEAGGIGYTQGYTTLDVFIANDPGKWVLTPFIDLRGHIFNNGKWAFNAGVGARKTLGCRVYGANVYYDYRNTSQIDFNQIGFGLETLGNLWDLRINGYLPVGSKVSSAYDIKFGGFRGNSVLVDRKFKYAMKGIDAEAGFHFGKTSGFEFYSGIGPYYFKGDLGKAAIGGKARAAGCYKQYVTLEFSDSYDTVFHNNFQAQLTLALPFGPKVRAKATHRDCPDICDFATLLATRMIQPVARQEIIVVEKKVKKDPAAGIGFIFVNNESHSNGTYESPYPTLLLAQDNSVPGNVIYVFQGDGTTKGMDQGIILQNEQKLWGSGVSQTLDTNFGPIVIPPQTFGPPQITNSSGNSAVTLAVDNQISGVTLLAPSSAYGITGYNENNPGNVSILSSTISGPSSSYGGIALVYVTGGPNTAVFDGLTISTPGGSGINIYVENAISGDVQVSICNSTFIQCSESINVGADAPVFALNVFINNNSILNDLSSPIQLIAFGGPLTYPTVWTVSNNYIEGAAGSSLYIEPAGNGPARITLNGNTVINGFYSEFYLENGGNSTFVMKNNTFSGSPSYSGIYMNIYNNANYEMALVGNNFSNNNGTGLILFSDNTANLIANVQENTFSNNMTGGLDFELQQSSTTCTQISGNIAANNNNQDYVFNNTSSGVNYLAPCNYQQINTGTFVLTHMTIVDQCNLPTPCE